MADDYYSVLGVERGATQADIQKAYRALARKHHPDLNPDDKTAKEKFQRIQQAFDVLNDPTKREQYDRYGASFEQFAQGAPHGGRAWSGQASPGFEDVDLSQFFGERFGGEAAGGFGSFFSQFRPAAESPKGRRGRGNGKRRGADLQLEVDVPFVAAVQGGEVQVGVERATGQRETITVKIPAGIETGQKIRLRDQGEPAPRGGSPGDLYIIARVGSHPYFERRGANLYVRTPVTLAEAALGAKVDLPSPQGTVSLRIPPGTSGGAKLRIKGLGIALRGQPPGDLIAEVEIAIPKTIDDKTAETIRDFDRRYPLSPRSGLRW